ncbi:MAG: hypothetical protein LBU34_14480 [Planctomycetaceae bacterium]|jgi:DNA-directed RNA polymerase subunit M/transcription elongation factor TFIIS|nr:hypothetical protein [Planctomycetaceae bacterium]
MIQFRCIRCQHAVEASEDTIGRRIYCPVCYLTLTVPATSTVQPVDESKLYTADAVPVDVREMENRKQFVSLSCPVCSTNISVTKEQIGTEIVCPECETKVRVPESIAEKAERALAEWARDNRTWDKRTQEERAKDGFLWNDRQLPPDQPNQSGKETYTLRDANNPAPEYRTIRVYCKLCGTMMYASDTQVGTELTCPDCNTKTIVPAPAKPVPLPPPLPPMFEGGRTFGLAGMVPQPAAGLLIPVVCSLCGTRMYAGENEIGGFKTCPDCGRKTEIKKVAQSEKIQPFISPNGGYGVSQSELQEKRPVFRTLTDYRYIEGSLDKELYDTKKPDVTEQGFLQPPVLYNPDSYSPDSYSDPETEIDSETLRERRAAKSANQQIERDIIKIVRRTPLPKYPFLNRIFVPFCDGRLLGQAIAASILCIAGPFLGTLLPGLFVVVSAPFGVLLLFLGLSLLSNTYLSLFLWTTVGNDLPEKDDWLEYRLLDSGSFTVWVFLLTILAVSPGYLLSSYIAKGTSEAVLLAFLLLGSFMLFFPVLFLSSMESGSYFIVLSKETCRSLITNAGVWLRFYFISFLLLVLFCSIILFVSFTIHHILTGFSLLIPVWSFFSLFYARFLGRLGWTLEETAYQTEKNKANL